MEWHLPGLIAPSNRTPPPRFVTDVVLELGLASHDDVHAAVEAAKATGGRAEAVLVQNGVLDDERLARALAERYGLDRLELDHFPFDRAAAALVSVETALHHEALPVAHLDGGRLLVAVADPAGGPAALAIAEATGREVVPAVAPRHRLRALIESAASRGQVPLPEPAPVEAPPGTEAPPGPFDAPPSAPEPGHDARRIAELERELAEAEEHVAAAEERAAAAEERLGAATQRAAAAEERAAAAEERLGAATQRVLELEGDLDHARAAIAAVRAAIGSAG